MRHLPRTIEKKIEKEEIPAWVYRIPLIEEAQLNAEELARYQRLAYLWFGIHTFFERYAPRDDSWTKSEEQRARMGAIATFFLEEIRSAYPGIKSVAIFSRPAVTMRTRKELQRAKRLLRTPEALQTPKHHRVIEEMQRAETSMKIRLMLEDLVGLMEALRRDPDPVHRMAMRAGLGIMLWAEQVEAEEAARMQAEAAAAAGAEGGA